MKKIISLVSVAILGVMVSNIAQALDCADDEVENNGKCIKITTVGDCGSYGSNCRYKNDSNNNFYIYSADGKDVTIPGWGFFYQKQIAVNNVVLDEKVTNVGSGAFYLYGSTENPKKFFCMKGNSICDGTDIRGRPTFQYEIDEENEGNIKIYNTDGTELQGVYKNWNNAFEDKVVDSYSTTDSVAGIQTTYNGRGQILSQIKTNDDGSRTIYDSENNIIGFKGKRIYTVEEAALVTKPLGNTFKIRYR